MQKFKTALFGTGFVGRVHLEAIRRLGYVEIYAIGEPQIEKANQLAAEFGVSRTEADYHRILEDPAVDAVHICTPNALHFPMAKDALLAGKHVICEKPLATSIEQAQELVNIAKEKKLRNCTSHNLRYYPMVQHMRRMIADGDIGDVMVLQGTYSQDWLLYDTDWNWRLDSKFNGKSRCLADIGSHWCDMAEHITGQRITSVCCDMATFHKPRKQPKGPIETFAGKTLSPDDYVETAIDTEDMGAVVFRMGNGARGAYTASQVNAGCKNRLEIEVDQRAMAEAIDAFGSSRLLSFDRDPRTGTPTIEVAHEALLREWGRLRGWIDAARDDVRMHRRLITAASEWADSDGDQSFLLRGGHLAQFESWSEESGLALTGLEREFVNASSAEGRREQLRQQRQNRRLKALLAGERFDPKSATWR